MYNLYNLEANQSFLINYRTVMPASRSTLPKSWLIKRWLILKLTFHKPERLYKAAEAGTLLLVFASCFLWLFI
jgi:hypothetical protein